MDIPGSDDDSDIEEENAGAEDEEVDDEDASEEVDSNESQPEAGEDNDDIYGDASEN